MATKPLIRVFLVLCAGFALLVGPSADAAKPGALDTTFGRAGKVITDFGRIDDMYDIAVQPNGKVVAVGDSYERGTPNSTFALARYTRSGSLDQTFGTGGKVTTDFGRTSSAAFAVALQADGRIVAAGATRGGIALARYDAHGSLDPTFGDGGRVVTDLQSHFQWASAIVIQPDGKLVVSGSTRQLGSYADFLVARYTSSGALDQSFGTGGIVSTDFQPGWTDYAYGVALLPGAKIVAAGVGLPGDAGGPGVIDIAVYDTNGHLDPRFDADGMLVSSPEVDSGAWGGVIAQPDGKVVVGANFGLVRYTASGALDRRFGIDGVAQATGGASDLARQPDGKLVTVGVRSGRSDTDINFGIARFNRSGLPDRAFHGGEAMTDMGGWDLAEAVAVQPDGRIVVGGSTERLDNGITQSGDFALARYLGVPNCRVPNVIGKTLRAARAMIARASCRLGRVGHGASARAPRGHVVAQRPLAGTNLPNGGKVNLVVSLGR
jgi:uncharacterized delta-60 repeat protein